MSATKTAKQRILDAVRIEPIRSLDEATAIAAATARLFTEQHKTAIIKGERVESLELEFNIAIEEFGREIDKNVQRLSTWAVKNRKHVFGDKKTLSLAGHKLAFREGTGKVEFTPGVKESDALDTILSDEDDAIIERFTTIKTSLNKNAVLAAWRTSQAHRDFLSACGITVTKEEKFSFEPDLDAVPESAPVVVGKSEA